MICLILITQEPWEYIITTMNNDLARLLLGLGIPESQLSSAMDNMNEWAWQVRNIESDDDKMRTPGIEGNTEKGVYQFIDDSVPVARQRMRNVGYNEDYIRAIKDNPQEWSPDQADAMFFGNMFSQADSDSLLREIALGSKSARREAYYRFHHTNPDAATIKRTQDYIPVLEQPVDDVMQEYNKTQKAFK